MDPQVAGLSLLLSLSRRAREAANKEEVGFIAANETRQIIEYRQAAVWLTASGVATLSGLPSVETSAPYTQWLTRALRTLDGGNKPRTVKAADLPEKLAAEWEEWLPPHAALAPLIDRSGEPFGFLFLAREREWSGDELGLLGELGSIYSQAYILVSTGRARLLTPLKRVGSKVGWLALAALLVGILAFPVRVSVQAPAEIVPRDPFAVRSPLDGVIDSFDVKPNEAVAEGRLLFRFDATALKARLNVESKALDIAEEEFRHAAQMALVDERARAEVATHKGRMEEKAGELAYARKLFARLEVRAPKSGVAVFSEAGDWVGKRVSTGERILTIADPANVEMLIRLPVSDAIDLAVGTPVRLYLAFDPENPIDGRITFASYRPETAPEGFAAYKVKAEITGQPVPPRIGLAGTARIYGEKATLAYYLLRRPLSMMRQKFGW